MHLSQTSGVEARVTPALLLAAAARAGGQLERLCVAHNDPLQAALLAVAAATADTLQLLRLEQSARGVFGFVTAGLLRPLLRAAPRQCVVEADVYADGLEDVRQMVRDHQRATFLGRALAAAAGLWP